MPYMIILKEIAASVLSVISFPAFAVEDADLVHLTRSVIVERLEVDYREYTIICDIAFASFLLFYSRRYIVVHVFSLENEAPRLKSILWRKY